MASDFFLLLLLSPRTNDRSSSFAIHAKGREEGKGRVRGTPRLDGGGGRDARKVESNYDPVDLKGEEMLAGHDA